MLGSRNTSGPNRTDNVYNRSRGRGPALSPWDLLRLFGSHDDRYGLALNSGESRLAVGAMRPGFRIRSYRPIVSKQCNSRTESVVAVTALTCQPVTNSIESRCVEAGCTVDEGHAGARMYLDGSSPGLFPVSGRKGTITAEQRQRRLMIRNKPLAMQR